MDSNLVLGLLWLPNFLLHILDLLSILARPLERYFYHEDLCRAYHIFAAISVYLPLWLNTYVKLSPLNDKLLKIRDSEASQHIGALNRFLLKGYLHGYFLLPNLVGPVWICWYMNAHDTHLDNLAHLYGFVMGLIHVPLLLSVSLKLLIPAFFACLRVVVVKVSQGVWKATSFVPENPAAVAQSFLRSLHGLLQESPDKITTTLDRKVLQSEHRFFEIVAGCAVTVLGVTLHGMVVDAFRPPLQRFAAHLVAEALMHIGDAIQKVGLLVESFVVKKAVWEGGSITIFDEVSSL